jgi:hypothetical protein
MFVAGSSSYRPNMCQSVGARPLLVKPNSFEKKKFTSVKFLISVQRNARRAKRGLHAANFTHVKERRVL